MKFNYKKHSPLLELVSIFLLAVLGVILSSQINLLETLYDWSRLHEHWQIDEIIIGSIVLTIGLTFFSIRRWREQIREHSELKELMIEKERIIAKLHEASDKIKILKGFLPICFHCKKIRDGEGSWQQLEQYISDHTEAQFSHGICPICLQEHYSPFLKEKGRIIKE